jgi:hypothetical protein
MVGKKTKAPVSAAKTRAWHEGKKTYAALAGVLASLIVSVAGRHGLDLGPGVVEIADTLTVLLTALAGFARKASNKHEEGET